MLQKSSNYAMVLKELFLSHWYRIIYYNPWVVKVFNRDYILELLSILEDIAIHEDIAIQCFRSASLQKGQQQGFK